MRYGFTTQALMASTIAIAPAMVTIQSIAIRHGRGSPEVIRSSGLRECRCRSDDDGCCSTGGYRGGG